MTADQRPHRADYRRAAALFLHRLRGDAEGVNAVLVEASELDRTSALILAVMNVAIWAPGSILPTDSGIAGLKKVIKEYAE
ncbi:hypothetical protein H7H78_11720 [Mycobacterium shinjukuense]|uniref:Uncharacterized protein n=1 Tax=Mycobacterium shinjukuense TaxID=398694 RepID=A0A7I7MJD5_9MYCO|nr:hypothetical protein [Mycobacterium shinjukuense]MCV6986075.1 hypothetical protein [Mycobacterium shinjukuense]ORB70078.1 hypothetical protein BST45_07300 [Mycobacterium shinjukuense]BBX72276.1 hypothetical protein MSHI_01820 [Mycobacterium shinjukuense]